MREKQAAAVGKGVDSMSAPVFLSAHAWGDLRERETAARERERERESGRVRVHGRHGGTGLCVRGREQLARRCEAGLELAGVSV